MLDIIWDQTYSVNIAEIDRQHQKFTGVLDMLFEAIEAGRSQGVLGEILRELAAYSDYHFETEENLMERYDYPGLEEHRKEHDGFRAKVRGFREDLLQGKATLTEDVIRFMTRWITEHVMDVDKKYGPFLNARGVY